MVWMIAGMLFLIPGTSRAAAGDDGALPEVRVGAQIADFSLRDIGGGEHRLESYAGKKAIVLAFNGVGCPISKPHGPRIQRLQDV